MNKDQCKMARAALDWSLDDLAAKSSVSRRTILRFEQGEAVQPEKLAAMREALEQGGAHFHDKGALAGGVQLRVRPAS